MMIQNQKKVLLNAIVKLQNDFITQNRVWYGVVHVISAKSQENCL